MGSVIRIALSMSFVLLVFVSFACWGGGMIVGGPCEYKQYPGKAVITSITPGTEPGKTPGESYVVKFTFSPEQEIQEEFARTAGKEFLLLLTNSTYPGPRFLEKYGIRVGKVFDCVMKVIVKGTCTPRIFEFPSIRLDDYSED
jgi:hypothetical protein